MSTPRPFGDELAQAVRKYLHDNAITQSKLTGEILADIGQRFYEHYQAKQTAKKKRGDATPEEREIYLGYPRHIAPQDAYQAIRGALQRVGKDRLLERVQAFARCVQRWPENYRYSKTPEGSKRDICPYPATWFRDGRWEDDEKEWLPAGMYQRPDDPAEESSAGNHRPPPALLEPPGWLEEFPKSVFKDWKEVPTDSRKAICDHMNKQRI